MPLYDAGNYPAAADLGRELLAQHPDNGRLAYNVACCESLAGRAADAVEHLRIAVGADDGVRRMAAEDADFDPIRDDPVFRKLIGG
jgi:thioredoxin-like negative regulator of GroEL